MKTPTAFIGALTSLAIASFGILQIWDTQWVINMWREIVADPTTYILLTFLGAFGTIIFGVFLFEPEGYGKL